MGKGAARIRGRAAWGKSEVRCAVPTGRRSPRGHAMDPAGQVRCAPCHPTAPPAGIQPPTSRILVPLVRLMAWTGCNRFLQENQRGQGGTILRDLGVGRRADDFLGVCCPWVTAKAGRMGYN